MDRPIIFSGPMVNALLEGRKTQTRRILKPQPSTFPVDGKECEVTLMHVEGDPLPRIVTGCVITRQEVRFAVGDRLWVRENFAHVGTCDPGFLTYQATYPNDLPAGMENVPATLKEAGYRWKPSIHMPRDLSRITLVVTGIKIERLNDISEEDAVSEGCKVIRDGCCVFSGTGYDRAGLCHSNPVTAFSVLWDEIHGADAWAANPFVVALTFRVIHANINSRFAA